MRNRSLLLPRVAVVVAALCLPHGARAAKENFQRTKPHVNIGVMGDDFDFGVFQSVSGLGVETEVVEDPVTVRKRPGRTKYSNITLKRGYTGDTSLSDWATEGLRDGLSMRDLHIVLLSPSAEPISSFDLVSCFPVRWDVGATSPGGATETIVVTCERVELKR